MLASRSITEQMAAFQARLDAAAASVIAGPGESQSPPPILPLQPAGAFPPATWHSDLPSTGLPSLKEWSSEGLSEESRTRIGNVISVYALGFHQLVRAVRAGMAAPSSTIANLWKMFVFLLNDCMPDGSVYAMRIAAMERAQSQRARELIAQREGELARLVQMEAELQQTVRGLDQGLRHIQTNRQEAEDARLEALDSIDEQESLQHSTAEEIGDLELQAKKWQSRFHLAANRHRMLSEDIRQYQIMQFNLKTKHYATLNQITAAEVEETEARNQYDSLVFATEGSQDKLRRLQIRQHELNQSCARSAAESQDLSWQCVQLGGKIGQLTAIALRKIQERILVVKQVEKIKEELHKVVEVEIAASSMVSTLSFDRESLSQAIDALTSEGSILAKEVKTLLEDIAQTREAHVRKDAQIEAEEKRIAEIRDQHDHGAKIKKKMEDELDSLESVLETEDANIALAEKRLSSAMSAVQALSDRIRNTKTDNKSLLREVRVLIAHREQLTQEISKYEENIDQHQAIVEAKIDTLKKDISTYETHIVASAEKSKDCQEQTVQLKQAQLDLTAQINTAEAEFEKTSLASAAQQTHLAGVEAVAKESAEKRDHLAKELEAATEERRIGREALDELQATHYKRAEELQKTIDETEGRAKESQQDTQHARQKISSLSADRQALEMAHDRALHSYHQETEALDVDYTESVQRHLDWISQTQDDQKKMQLRLKELQEQLLLTQRETVELDVNLGTAVGNRQTEQDRVAKLAEQLARDKQANAAHSVLVSSLSAEVAHAAHQQEKQLHDNQTIHHLLEYTLLTNSALDRRDRDQLWHIQRRAQTETRDAQTVADWKLEDGNGQS